MRLEEQALKRVRELHSLLRARGKQKKPCVAYGVLVDDDGRRYPVWATSGKGYLTRELMAAVNEGEELASADGDMHAEVRIVRYVQEIRKRQAEMRKDGQEAERPGLRLESVAAAYDVCMDYCQGPLEGEGTRLLTAYEPGRTSTPEQDVGGQGRGRRPPGGYTEDVRHDRKQGPKR